MPISYDGAPESKTENEETGEAVDPCGQWFPYRDGNVSNISGPGQGHKTPCH